MSPEESVQILFGIETHTRLTYLAGEFNTPGILSLERSMSHL